MDFLFTLSTDNTPMTYEVKMIDGGLSTIPLTDAEVEDIFDVLKAIAVAHYPMSGSGQDAAYRFDQVQVVP